MGAVVVIRPERWAPQPAPLTSNLGDMLHELAQRRGPIGRAEVVDIQKWVAYLLKVLPPES